jgi:flagellar assembly protein FliH
MSSLSEVRPAGYRSADRPDLRTGHWTRLGDSAVLGDEATEAALGGLAERTRRAARAQGYAVGWAEGRQEALTRAAQAADDAERRAAQEERHRAAEHAAAVAGLARAAAALEAASAEVTARIADQATTLALELTRTLVGHELAVAAEPGAGVVARVLAVLPSDPTTQVRLHPDTVGAAAARLLDDHRVRLVADPTLAADDAVVETDTTAIDLRVSTALARLAEVLR